MYGNLILETRVGQKTILRRNIEQMFDHLCVQKKIRWEERVWGGMKEVKWLNTVDQRSISLHPSVRRPPIYSLHLHSTEVPKLLFHRQYRTREEGNKEVRGRKEGGKRQRSMEVMEDAEGSGGGLRKTYRAWQGNTGSFVSCLIIHFNI